MRGRNGRAVTAAAMRDTQGAVAYQPRPLIQSNDAGRRASCQKSTKSPGGERKQDY